MLSKYMGVTEGGREGESMVLCTPTPQHEDLNPLMASEAQEALPGCL